MPVPVKLRELERALNNVYLKIYREIKKDRNYPNNIGALQLRFNKLVYDNTRSAVQQAVILGNERVNRISKKEPYLTQQDLNLIKKNAQDQTDSFWRKIHLDIFRKQEQQALVGGAEIQLDENGGLIPPPDLDMTAYLLAVATASLFGSFADSTLSKTSELADTVTEKPKVQWKATLDERTCDQLPDGSEGCNIRDGRIYEYDDPELQIHMPGSVHYYCRCELIPII